MVRGWCLYDLGRPRDAARIIDRPLATIPEGATRAQARFGVRRALAYAAAGDIDYACRLISGLLDDLMRARSATIATDLRALARSADTRRTLRSVTCPPGWARRCAATR
jgi:hypothetical protein